MNYVFKTLGFVFFIFILSIIYLMNSDNLLKKKIKSKIFNLSEKNRQIEKLKNEIITIENSETRMDLEESYYTLYEYHSKHLENSFAKKKNQQSIRLVAQNY